MQAMLAQPSQNSCDKLRETYRVIDFTPVRRKRPTITLRTPRLTNAAKEPRHYIYHSDPWDSYRHAVFDRLGSRAFSAEYMYLIAQYESALANRKHGRRYWFFPLDRISEMFHVSTRFASTGLGGLIDLGIIHVAYGQFGITPKANEFGRANRYYFEGFSAALRRDSELRLLSREFAREFDVALALAANLTNGTTVRNVTGICELITEHGERRVRTVFARLASLPPRSLKRRLPYVRSLLSDE